MRILTNHIGYEPSREKYALLSCGGEQWLSDEVVCEVVGDGDPFETVFVPRVGPRTEVDGWSNRFFYRVDFSALTAPGRYRIRVRDGKRQVTGAVFEIAPGVVADSCVSDVLFYYKSQRAGGRWNDADRRVPFYGERQGRVDLSGGWYDASGDYSKYLSHLSYANFLNPQQTPLVVWSLLTTADALSSSPVYRDTLIVDRAMEEALYGADFLVRMHDPAGYFYTTVFDQWSKDTEQRVVAAFRGQEGTLLEGYQAGFRQGGGMAIAALAKASRYSTHGDYSNERYLEVAHAGWDHLVKNNVEYLDDRRENVIDVYCALLAAVELARATGDPALYSAAKARMVQLVALYDGERGYWRIREDLTRPFYHASDGGLPIVALVEFALLAESLHDMDARREAMEVALRAVRDIVFVSGETGENPFGIAKQWVQGVAQPLRPSFFVPHDNESGYWWQGENARLGSVACAVRRVVSVCGRSLSDEEQSRLRSFADRQLDWIMGYNPFDACMLHGHGRNNPRYEDHYPNAPGGICNGVTAGFDNEGDIAFLPSSVGSQGDHRWRWSEQWIPHAAWFLLAIDADVEDWRRM